jgi:hypothetical protein
MTPPQQATKNAVHGRVGSSMKYAVTEASATMATSAINMRIAICFLLAIGEVLLQEFV